MNTDIQSEALSSLFCFQGLFRQIFGRGDHRFYDSLSRLLEANYNNGATVYNYGYDVAGNMVDYDGVSRTYNAANQMTNDGTNTLTYDNNGNLVNDGVDTYSWDRANRLLSVGNHIYVYDGMGNRVQQTVSSVVTDYLNDLQPGLTKLLSQTTGANTEHFVHGVRGIHAVDDGTDWNFYMQDGLGSVRAVVDEMAVVQISMGYDPYGNPMGSYGAGFGFTGEQTGEDGSVFLRARYYEPGLGVFNALDPMETPNRYAYVSGNPINRVDPTGLFDWNSMTTEPGDCLYCIGRELGLITDTTDNQDIRDWLVTMQNANQHAIQPSTWCRATDLSCDPRLWQDRQLTVIAPQYRIEAARNGFGYGQYCQSPYSQSVCNPEAAPTATPAATSTPMPTATCTPTSTPTPWPTYEITPVVWEDDWPPTATPTPTQTPNRYRFMLGVRGDASATAFIGLDANVEFQIIPRNAFPVYGEWKPLFVITFNPGLEFSDPGAGATVGVVFGGIRDNAIGQETNITYTGGLDVVPFVVGPMGEFDISASDNLDSIVGFIGTGVGSDTPVSGYIGTGTSTVLFTFNPVASVVRFFSGN